MTDDLAEASPQNVGGWPKEACIDAVQKAAADLGKPPTVEEYKSMGRVPSSKSIRSRFGGWNPALEAAGLDPNQASCWSREACIEAVARALDEVGEPLYEPTYVELAAGRGDLPSAPTVVEKVGGFPKARQEAMERV